jgi:methionyl-tRNA formyltransferase
VSLRVVFMGTGDFAVPSLQALKAAGHKIVLAVCQPDRPRGRGHQWQAPPLKEAALALGLELFQPEKLRAPEAVERLKAAKADLGCVVSYGQILSQEALDAPRLGCVNVHASLLPRWRGAAPIEWALAEGDTQTGVCVQRMALKLDAGDIILAKTVALKDSDEAPALHQSLAQLGAQALLEALALLEAGKAPAQPQDESQASYARLLKKSDGFLDPARPARELLNRFRAFKARPGAQIQLEGGERLKLHALSLGSGRGPAGRLLALDEAKGLEVAVADASLWLGQVQAPGAKALPGAAWARGRHLKAGAQFVVPVKGPEE